MDMENNDQEDKDLDDIAARIITIGAKNLQSLREKSNTEAQNIFDSPQKHIDIEPKKFVQPIFFGPLRQQENFVSQQNVEFTTKTSAADITEAIIEEINKPLHKPIVDAELIAKENLLPSTPLKTDADGDIQDAHKIIERDHANISVVAETSRKSAEEFLRQKYYVTPPKPVPQKTHWKKKVYKFLMLGVAHKLEVGYPPGYPIVKSTKSSFRKKPLQESKSVSPQANIQANKYARNDDAQVNNKKDVEPKLSRTTKGDIIMLNNIKKSNTSDYFVTETNEISSK